ncbi:hypothetical protein [Ferruginibacter profundus]
MVWKSKGDGEKRKYDFGYDAANRLLKADFTQYTNSSFNQSAGVNFNVIMGNGTTLPDGGKSKWHSSKCSRHLKCDLSL